MGSQAPEAPFDSARRNAVRRARVEAHRSIYNSNQDIDMAKGNNSHKKEVKKPKKEKPKPLPTRRGS
jgi:hypothetical protein